MNNNMPNNMNGAFGPNEINNNPNNYMENRANEQLMGGQSNAPAKPDMMQGFQNVQNERGAMQGMSNVPKQPGIMQGMQTEQAPQQVNQMPGQGHSGINGYTMQKEQPQNKEVISIPGFSQNQNVPNYNAPQPQNNINYPNANMQQQNNIPNQVPNNMLNMNNNFGNIPGSNPQVMNNFTRPEQNQNISNQMPQTFNNPNAMNNGMQNNQMSPANNNPRPMNVPNSINNINKLEPQNINGEDCYNIYDILKIKNGTYQDISDDLLGTGKSFYLNNNLLSIYKNSIVYKINETYKPIKEITYSIGNNKIILPDNEVITLNDNDIYFNTRNKSRKN